ASQQPSTDRERAPGSIEVLPRNRPQTPDEHQRGCQRPATPSLGVVRVLECQGNQQSASGGRPQVAPDRAPESEDGERGQVAERKRRLERSSSCINPRDEPKKSRDRRVEARWIPTLPGCAVLESLNLLHVVGTVVGRERHLDPSEAHA